MGCVKTGQVFTVLRPILGGCHLTGSAQASDLTSNVTFLGPPTAHISTTESKPTERHTYMVGSRLGANKQTIIRVKNKER